MYFIEWFSVGVQTQLRYQFDLSECFWNQRNVASSDIRDLLHVHGPVVINPQKCFIIQLNIYIRHLMHKYFSNFNKSIETTTVKQNISRWLSKRVRPPNNIRPKTNLSYRIDCHSLNIGNMAHNVINRNCLAENALDQNCCRSNRLISFLCSVSFHVPRFVSSCPRISTIPSRNDRFIK